MNDRLIVSEIFLSIQGESTRAGLPCVLVRLAGCNLQCAWCDTPYARDAAQGKATSVAEVLAQAAQWPYRRVEVTGGEPLTQEACMELLQRFCDAGYETLLETNGSLNISAVDPRVIRIVDFKCPASGQTARNRWENVTALTDRDEVKFVLADRRDYEFACAAVAARRLAERAGAVIFSPVDDRLAPADLAEWVLRDGLDVRIGLQLHRIIWPGRQRGV